MSLSHYSDEQVLSVYSVEQEVRDYRSCFDKPKGLWVSVDGEYDWASWCEDNFALGPLRHRVCLTDSANILRITSAGALLDFRYQWGRDTGHFDDIYIPWEDVAKLYQGIIIAPYQWSCRIQESWYYGWDCASGCIWDAGAIAGVEQIREAA